MLSRSSACPNRSAIADLNKKDSVRPTEIPSRSGTVFRYLHSPKLPLGLSLRVLLVKMRNGRNLIGHNRFLRVSRTPSVLRPSWLFMSFWLSFRPVGRSQCWSVVVGPTVAVDVFRLLLVTVDVVVSFGRRVSFSPPPLSFHPLVHSVKSFRHYSGKDKKMETRRLHKPGKCIWGANCHRSRDNPPADGQDGLSS